MKNAQKCANIINTLLFLLRDVDCRLDSIDKDPIDKGLVHQNITWMDRYFYKLNNETLDLGINRSKEKTRNQIQIFIIYCLQAEQLFIKFRKSNNSKHLLDQCHDKLMDSNNIIKQYL